MKIGILGSGNVGGALGKRWAQGGHTVLFSSREPDSPEMRELVASAGSRARAGSTQEAAAFGEVVLVATPWAATEQAVKGAGDLSGKIVIDAVNPLQPDMSGLAIGTTTSAAEILQAMAPTAHVVKAFNTIGSPIMEDPNFGDKSALLFYCGDDAAAKQVVHQLATELGFQAKDAGPLKQARLLEPFALLWISLAFQQNYGRSFAFDLLTR